MGELGRYSTPSYISLIVLVFYSLTIIILYTLFNLNKKNIIKYVDNVKYKKIKNLKKWIILFYLVALILIFNILVSGSPLWIATINKTTFWTIAKFSFLKPISSQIHAISLFSGMLLLYSYNHNKSKGITISLFGILILLLIYLVLMGHKFGQLYMLIYMFFLPIITNKILKNTLVIHKLLINIAMIILALSVAVMNYYEMKYGSNATEMIKQRIFAMDGQLIYVGIENYLNETIPNDFNQLLKEIKYIFGFNSDPYVGMKFLMKELMPSSIYYFYEENSVTLAKGYLPMLFYLFNSFVFVIIIHVIFISIYFYVAFTFLKSIVKLDFIFTFLYMKLYFAFLGYYAQAYTTIILNTKTLAFVFLIVMVTLLRKKTKQKKRQK